MTQVVNLHFRLEVDSNQNIPNPVDLCRILNYNLKGKVLGYNCLLYTSDAADE